MVKILLKAAVLLFIVFSIYFIVHPAACSNMMAGREAVPLSEAERLGLQHPMAEPGQTFSSDGYEDHTDASSGTVTEDGAYAPYNDGQGLIDTNTMKEMTRQPVYSQQDIDYAIASRYVELEREYARHHTVGKDTSREISFIVMDDFEMSPAEWESFLSRATASDLFDKVRRELPPETAAPAAESAEK